MWKGQRWGRGGKQRPSPRTEQGHSYAVIMHTAAPCLGSGAGHRDGGGPDSDGPDTAFLVVFIVHKARKRYVEKDYIKFQSIS
jgi:hypothetical protein